MFNILICIRLTICPGFSGTVPIFNNVPQKKSQFSGDAHLSCFWLSVPAFCPNLPISAAICLRIGGQKLGQILSVYTKISLLATAPPRILLGELTMLPQTTKLDPRRLKPVALVTLRFSPLALIPDRDEQIMVTLYMHGQIYMPPKLTLTGALLHNRAGM